MKTSRDIARELLSMREPCNLYAAHKAVEAEPSADRCDFRALDGRQVTAVKVHGVIYLLIDDEIVLADDFSLYWTGAMAFRTDLTAAQFVTQYGYLLSVWYEWQRNFHSIILVDERRGSTLSFQTGVWDDVPCYVICETFDVYVSGEMYVIRQRAGEKVYASPVEKGVREAVYGMKLQNVADYFNDTVFAVGF